ncbi:ferrous iron transport protein B [Halodesulfovibrio sp.]|uniref:ferrous iron transport protein B n=1 Tax=Halodesulfovibrio sp. TaxID=1912772 RepID=UPI0025C33B4A|nr:ferrous iron transport protein B [Halodesulfovibrio sp.]
MDNKLIIALAGQPNCGKSTVFNMLTGARQHVANYPGVTVEKKVGAFSIGLQRFDLVDLPGTYSLTSYSLEERVARDVILHDDPEVLIDVVDASNIQRHLYLTVQLLEMERPMVVSLNMMDVAERRNIVVKKDVLQQALGVPVVSTVGKKSIGREELLLALENTMSGTAVSNFKVDYGILEPYVARVMERLHFIPNPKYPLRWLAVKLLEDDSEAITLLKDSLKELTSIYSEIMLFVEANRNDFVQKHELDIERVIAKQRHQACSAITEKCVSLTEKVKENFSDSLDRYVCHKFFGPLILFAILFCLYQVSIVLGNDLAQRIWPMWAGLGDFLMQVFPQPEFLVDPMLRSLGSWVIQSVTAILNYLPIFFLLFSLIAILEDSGYMPRMAFLLDRLFRTFGMHGQSTLPLILGGVYVGGCAIPGVMATKAIPDERARLTTLMVVPMMNCLAKVPLYLILISAYFSNHAGIAMFFIATVTLFMALPVAKILSLTVLSKYESAPFIMEMPAYHLPTVSGVLRRAVERMWLFVKKIVTVVIAVAVIVFMLINFPNLSKEVREDFAQKEQKAIEKLLNVTSETSFHSAINEKNIMELMLFVDAFKKAKRGVKNSEKLQRIDASFAEQNLQFYTIAIRDGVEAKRVLKALRKAERERRKLRRKLRAAQFENSFLGMMGHALEPVTQYAGFNWRINIALLSAFAAKENSAATLGAIYGIDGSSKSVQDSMVEGETGFTPLHALALMLFMALYPPCIPTLIMVRMQTASTKLMCFSIAYQALLGLGVATFVFTGGTLLNLSGLQMMWLFYGLCVVATILVGLLPKSVEFEKMAVEGRV